MTRIVYGLCGVGIGHVIRGRIIIEHLKKKNDVMVVCSHWPYLYLSKIFDNVYRIEGFELAFRNNSIINYLTLALNLKKFSWKTFKRLDIVKRIIDDFKPDIVISDWETFSSILAKRYDIPLISIDNQHFLIKGKLEFPKRYFWSYIKAKFVVILLMKKADYYIISSFYETKLKRRYKNIFLVPPILRDDILKAKIKERAGKGIKTGDYILVYQSTNTYHELIEILRKINYNFIIYGFGKRKRIKNLEFKDFNEKEFINDLIGCKGVICNGGFTLISEAIHLNKPILSIPIRGHFEQLLNATYVSLKGYGESYNDLDIDIVNMFIKNLNRYKIRRFYQKDNSRVFKVLDRIIEKI